VPQLRLQPPDRLPGTTSFAQDDELRGSLNMVRLLKSQRWVWDELRAACDLEKNWGRRREAGHWELAAVAFVVSGHVDVQPWLDSTTDELWRECGFSERPPYKRVWRRLRELEEHVDAFLDATGALVQHARRHDARVGAHVHFDGTEDETQPRSCMTAHPTSVRAVDVAPPLVAAGPAAASDRSARAHPRYARSASAWPRSHPRMSSVSLTRRLRTAPSSSKQVGARSSAYA
jgi:hypothetical protein